MNILNSSTVGLQTLADVNQHATDNHLAKVTASAGGFNLIQFVHEDGRVETYVTCGTDEALLIKDDVSGLRYQLNGIDETIFSYSLKSLAGKLSSLNRPVACGLAR